MKNYTVIPIGAAEKLHLNDLYVFTALCLTTHDDNTTDVTYEQLADFTGKSLGYICKKRQQAQKIYFAAYY